ncbi:MAG: 1-deoxy-D-xylulose-5-phosphate synthase [Clostridiales bacterium]|nr:1-deoxy-D-xylulose-5-phosphate synthase [Clostridiales bacterium]
MLLEQIEGPSDVKKLDAEQLRQLAEEIRAFLIEKISVTGGHLASNLGVVELTIALYLAFDLPKDKVIWDVGHQSYTHKILSGRREFFDGLRQFGGMSGFPKRKESPYDAFDTGHSSTSISAGLGIAQGRDLLGEDYAVISVIGDGALTGGMAFEALNNAARMKRNFIIVLNDNNMSISENVGGMSRYLNTIRSAAGYNRLKKQISGALENIPVIGDRLVNQICRTKNSIKQLMIPGMLFENMGVTYLGPVDGHDVSGMVKLFREARKMDHAVLVHVLTKKGKGYAPAEKQPARFHGVEPFDIATGQPKNKKIYPSYTDVFSSELCRLAESNPRIVAVTAAMPDGTGLKRFQKQYPERFFDVGIAEQHAVTSAAGMAAAGLKPVVAIYSSFLQRGYDQILHDVCIQNLPVVFAIDRAGLVGSDGETHQGIFDLSYLTSIPNMTVLAPKNLWELRRDLDFAIEEYDGPIAIRYPRGQAYRGLKESDSPVVYGKGELISQGREIALLAVGSMVSTAEHIRDKLRAEGWECTLANGRFIKPVDTELIDTLASSHSFLVTLEENVLQGGFGLQVTAYMNEHYPQVKVLNIALPDAYVEHGNVSLLRESLGIDSDSIIRRMRETYLDAKITQEAGTDPEPKMSSDARIDPDNGKEEPV